jgi:PIN domain nuclease of toxin-antitoxin system
MRILLDTHVFLWFISGDMRIPPKYRLAIENPANEVFLSVVSLWEAAIKHATGKLQFPIPPGEMLPIERRKHGIASLALDESPMARWSQLPPVHRDPFDRMLVCQAIEHQLAVATVDPLLAQYPIAVLPF